MLPLLATPQVTPTPQTLATPCQSALRTFYKKKIQRQHGASRAQLFTLNASPHKQTILMRSRQTRRVIVPKRINHGWGVIFGYAKGGECGYTSDDFLVYFQPLTTVQKPTKPKSKWRRGKHDGPKFKDIDSRRQRGYYHQPHMPENWQNYTQISEEGSHFKATILTPSTTQGGLEALKRVVKTCLR